MITRILLTVALGLIYVCGAQGQMKQAKPDLVSLAKSDKLQVFNHVVSPLSEPGKEGIRFSENETDGVGWIEGITFTNGVIELDLRGRDVAQKSFIGVAFHCIDEKNPEIVYFRPFNFRSTDSVRRIHAVQYVSMPDFGWKKLREEQNGKYEKAVVPAPQGDDWFHAKIVVHYPRITVYVNASSTPSLSVGQLSARKTGRIGLWVGPGSNGDFANLVVTYE